ncbi:MAG: GNAT family N-acetyltransferase [Anaerolineae bacterium]
MAYAKLIHGDAVFNELAEVWNDLAGQGMTDTPFQRLAYQRAWWQLLHPPDSTLHTVIVRGEQGNHVAIGCFYLHEGALYFNGCVEETDYLDLIALADQAEAAWTAVFECLHSPEAPPWKTIDLCNIPADSPTRTILPRLAARYGLSFAESVHEVCPIIKLPQSFAAYLEGLDKKQRHEVRRKLRRAAGAGAEVVTVGPDDDLEQAVNAFLDLLQKSTVEKREWLNDGRRAVFHETARDALEAGILQLMFIEVEGQKAAALFNFDYRSRIWVYNSGLNPALFGNLSLGVVLTARSIEMAIENGRAVFDFLRGNETYKYRFGAVDTKIYRLQLARGNDSLRQENSN